MTHWEHMTFAPALGVAITFEDLDTFGARGWELVTIISRPGMAERAVFKRPVAVPAAPTKPVATKAVKR